MEKHIAKFELTDEQYGIMQPLFEEVSAEFADGKKGLIVSKIYNNGTVKAIFVEDEYAEKVQKILIEWWDKLTERRDIE